MSKNRVAAKGVAPGSREFGGGVLAGLVPRVRLQAAPPTTAGAGVGSGLLPEKPSRADQMSKQKLTCRLSNLM